MNGVLKLARFLKPYWVWAVLAPLFMLLEVVMDLMQPKMVARIIDQGIAVLDLQVVFQTGIWMVGFACIGAIGGVCCGICAETAAVGFGADMREFLFKKVQTFSFSNLDDFDTGQLITRLTNDVTQLQEAVVMMLRILVRSPLLLLGSLVMAVITSPYLGMILLFLIPIELFAVIWIVRKATPLYIRVQAQLDKLNEIMQENLAGVRVVKSFVNARHEIKRFEMTNQQLTGQTVHAARLVSIMPAFMMLILNIGIIAVLWFGGISVTKGNLQVGQIIAFINYLSITLFSLVMVSTLVIQLARADASAKRTLEVIDKEPDICNPEREDMSWSAKGQISFDDVTFRYNGNETEPVLKGITFSSQPGETVAILGTTGSGKTSLVNLIPRFYDANNGRILIDGVDVRDLNQESLRRKIGVVLQEVVLFSGTVRDNIRFGNQNASDDEVVWAAKAAQAHEFIMSFPEGYETQIGQRGVNLSGGQKQRIAIARALILKPSILILDDSTSAVDVETEVKIQDAFETMTQTFTNIIIAQRISTVLNADRILLLEDGQIVAQGTHKSLLATSPIYRDIHESQLGNGAIA
jgi:ATP-binding cassette, subfamily B, multidrug efflux pump